MPAGANSRRGGGHWLSPSSGDWVIAMCSRSGVDPDRLVDDAVHARVGVDPFSETWMPVLPRVLGEYSCRWGLLIEGPGASSFS